MGWNIDQELGWNLKPFPLKTSSQNFFKVFHYFRVFFYGDFPQAIDHLIVVVVALQKHSFCTTTMQNPN